MAILMSGRMFLPSFRNTLQNSGRLRVVIPRVTHSADRRLNIALQILRRDEVPNLARRIRRHSRVGIFDDGKERPRCMYQGDPG